MVGVCYGFGRGSYTLLLFAAIFVFAFALIVFYELCYCTYLPNLMRP